MTGVGPGTGAAIARRFAGGGYRVAMLARSAERLRELAAEIDGARGYAVDVADLGALARTCETVRAELGAPAVAIHNAVAGGFETWDQVAPETLEARFRLNVTAFLALAQAVAPAMVAAGRGAILATGNTAALRGKPMAAGFAPTKAAQRVLAESLARSLGPQGVHVAYLLIDAVIDVPWTRAVFRDKPDDFFARPDAIADAAFFLAEQPRSAWTFLLEVRPHGESW